MTNSGEKRMDCIRLTETEASRESAPNADLIINKAALTKSQAELDQLVTNNSGTLPVLWAAVDNEIVAEKTLIKIISSAISLHKFVGGHEAEEVNKLILAALKVGRTKRLTFARR